MKIGFISLGCAKNLTDTESMIGILNNFKITNDASDADVIVVNTCAFIDSAKEESISAILDMAKYKESGKCKMLIVTGCLAQRYKDEIFSLLPEVDAVLGTNDYNKIAQVINDFLENHKKIINVSNENDHIKDDIKRVVSTPSHYAYLKIADGCDNRCTYCIIPKLRGNFKSRSEESILKEANELVKNGAKELILVAQDTAYYGADRGERTLHLLLKKLSRIEGLKWIRLQYCYPENITDELICEIANNEKVVKYIDMPLQHISDNILRKMGRKSREEEIKDLIKTLREKIPDIVIRTSLIVGFPGETNEDFKKLSSFLEEAHLDKVGVFAYSKEEGTPAYSFDGQIEDNVKEKRRKALMKIQKGISKKNNKRKIGKIVSVIVEDYDFDEYCYVGRTYGDTPDVDGMAYIFSKTELERGSIVNMKVLNADEYDVTGEVVNEFTK